jgi:hypothetical protein
MVQYLQFCLKFVLDSALLVQKKVIDEELIIPPNLRKAFCEYEVIKKDIIELSIDSKYRETLCEVDVGQILLGYFGELRRPDFVAVFFDYNIAYIDINSVRMIEKKVD